MTCRGCKYDKKIQTHEERCHCDFCKRAYAGADADMYEDRYEAAQNVPKVNSVCNGCAHMKAEKTDYDNIRCKKCQRTYLETGSVANFNDLYETVEDVEKKVKNMSEKQIQAAESAAKKASTKNKRAKHLLETLALMLLYCIVWVILEYIAKGSIQNDPVDNIMMALLFPVFLLATKDTGKEG